MSEQKSACSSSFTVLTRALVHGAFFVGMLRTRVDRNRAPRRRLVGVQWLGCALLLWSWWCVAKGRGVQSVK